MVNNIARAMLVSCAVLAVSFVVLTASPAAADTVLSGAGSLAFDLATARTEATFTVAEMAVVDELWLAALVACGIDADAAVERPRVYLTAITEKTRRTGVYVAGVYLPERHVVVVERLDFENLVHEFVHAVVARTEGKRKTADEAYLHSLVDAYVAKLRTTVVAETTTCQPDDAVLDAILGER